MKMHAASLIAAQACCIIIGWHVANFDWQLVRRLSWAALHFLDPWPRWIICYKIGVTVGQLAYRKRQ